MNHVTTRISEEVRESIKAAPPNEWKIFFEDLRQTEFKRIRSVTEKELTELPVRVRLLDELEEFFLATREQKAKPVRS